MEIPGWKKRMGIIAAAWYAYYHRNSIGYTQSAERGRDFGPPPNVPGNTDCSAFATWCYKSAKCRDPNGLGYSWIGYTGTLVKHGHRLSSKGQLIYGDLVFYGGSRSVPGHVAVYVGQGKVISHGSSPGPLLLAVGYRPIIDMRSYF